MKKKRGAKKAGRPSKYSVAVAEVICNRLAAGESLIQMTKEPGMPCEKSVYTWLLRHPAFAQKYEEARRRQASRYAEEIVDIADTADDSSGPCVQKAHLRVDARKWVASKLLPKVYGDRSQVEHSGKDGGPIKVVNLDITALTDEELASLEAILLKAKKP